MSKYKTPLITSLFLLSTLASLYGKDFSSAKAVSPMPTNINVTDLSDTQVNAFYSSVAGTSGNALLAALNPLIDDHNEYDYESDTHRLIYKIIDRNWDLSPESSANLTNFNYTNDMPYIRKFYADYNDNISTADLFKNPGASRVSFDKEHLWAQSLGNFGRIGGAGSDFHTLVPSDVKGNQQLHSNYNFATPTSSVSSYVNDKGTYVGINGYIPGFDAKVMEPLDAYKGDIARAMFYMPARYYTYQDVLHPKLTLVNGSPDAVTASSSQPGLAGDLATLLEWNELDPVDEYEIHRNNLIYNNYQQNRNPFIDHPEWARIAYDTSYSGPGASVAAGSSSVGTPVTDPYESAALLSIDLDTNNVKTTFALEDTFTSLGLVVTAYYDGGLSRQVTAYVTSVNQGTVLNNSGLQTITVSYTHNSVTKSETYQINVDTEPKSLTSISLNTTSVLKAFSEGDYFNYDGLEVTAHFDNSTSENVTEYDLTILGIDYLQEDTVVPTAGTYDVVISYTYRGLEMTSSYQITVESNDFSTINLTQTSLGLTSVSYTDNNKSHTVDNIAFTTYQLMKSNVTYGNSIQGQANSFTLYNENPLEFITNIKITYNSASSTPLPNPTLYGGTTMNPSSGTVVSSTLSGNVRTYDLSSHSFSYFHLKAPSVTSYMDSIEITYGQASKTLSHISAIPDNNEINYPVGTAFSYDSLQVFAHFSDSSSSPITNYTLTAPDTSTIGEKNVMVAYAGKQTSYSIKVGSLDSISVTPSVTSTPLFGTYQDNNLSTTATFTTGVSSFTTSVSQSYLTLGSLSTAALGSQPVSVSYTWSGVTKSTVYNVKVTNEGYVPSATYATDLLISEYIEGSSNNKAIEIYNGTGVSKTLTGYNLKIYFNGNTTVGNTINLSGTLASGSTYVVTHSSANATFLALANMTSSSLTHNGNDAVGLYNGTTLVDIVGTIGSSSNFAIDTTLVRKANANQPKTTYDATEWTVNAVDTTTYLGGHTMNLSSGSLDQAIAYAQFFLDMTAPYCATYSGDDAPWSELQNEYVLMTSGAKDEFKNSSNSTILQVKSLYQYLLNKYEITNYMVDGNNVLIFSSDDSVQIPSMVRKANENAVILLIVTAMSFASGYIVLRKKRNLD